MQVFRSKSLSLASIRHLYSAASLGMDGFSSNRDKVKYQYEDLADKFKEKMKDFSGENSNMVFTEDLKHMIFLADGNAEDLSLVKQMAVKFSKQNNEMRFGSFIFGPVLMRMYYYLDKPQEALEVFKALENDVFFDQLVSYQILMDLLLKHEMYNEVIEIFEIVKRKQLRGMKYSKNAVVLVLAACYKLNTPEAYKYAKQLWADLNEVGHLPMRRAGTFAASLAINQNEPHVGLEILTSLKNQSYVTIRNLKIIALADLGRPDDALPLLHSALDDRSPERNKSTICEESISKLRESIDKLGNSSFTEEFERLEKHLRTNRQIVNVLISDLLCSEIDSQKATEFFNKNNSNRQFGARRSVNYGKRPGLQDMVD